MSTSSVFSQLKYTTEASSDFFHISYYIFNYIITIWFIFIISLNSILYLMGHYHHQFSSVQSLSHVRLFVSPWITARQASLSITNSQSLLKLMPFESVMPSSHLIFCCPLLLLPAIPPSIRVFSNETTLRMRWPKYWSFSFSISPSKEQPGLISFRMDWLDLFAVQRTPKSLLQHHSSKATIGRSHWDRNLIMFFLIIYILHFHIRSLKSQRGDIMYTDKHATTCNKW